MYKKLLIVLSVVLLAVSGIGTAYAMLAGSIDKTSRFEIGYCDIDADKTNGLRIKNKSNLPCFVRVAVDVSDSEKRSLCHFEMSPNSGWTDTYADGAGGDVMKGYYYYTLPVKPEEYTPKLFSSVSYDDSSVSESDIRIYAEAIICADHDNYEDAWSSLD